MTGADERLDREARFKDYAQARLWIGEVRGRVLEVQPASSGVGDFPFDAPVVHVLTAFNPGSDRLSEAENEERQRRLVAELSESTTIWSAEAGAADGSHREASALVVGLSEEQAVALGLRWGQDAIFRWTPDAWSIVPCGGGPPTEAGWQLVEHRRPLAPGEVLRRHTRWTDGTSEDLAVISGPDVLTVGSGDRSEAIRGTLADVVARTPELRDLEIGTVSDYEVAHASLAPAELAALLHVVGVDSEDPSAWPDPEAERWHVEDGDEMVEGLEWRHRWVEVNGEWASAVVVPGRDELQLVLIEDEDHLAVIEPIADFDWSSDGGGRPMSTDGGHSLGRLAPGLLYQRRWGDFGPEHHLVPVDDGPAAVARALAEWVDWAEAEQSLALSEEPLDPEGTLPEEERETLRRQLALCDISLTFPRDEVGHLARAEVAAASEFYRRTRDALARPNSEDGQALRALLTAVDEGEDVPDSVTWAMWQ